MDKQAQCARETRSGKAGPTPFDLRSPNETGHDETLWDSELVAKGQNLNLQGCLTSEPRSEVKEHGKDGRGHEVRNNTKSFAATPKISN